MIPDNLVGFAQRDTQLTHDQFGVGSHELTHLFIHRIFTLTVVAAGDHT